MTISERDPDPLQIQISAHVQVPKGRTITGKVLREAIAYRVANGDDPPGIELSIVRWRHGSKPWKYGDDWDGLAGPLYGWSGYKNPDVDTATLRSRQTNRARKSRTTGL